MIQKILEEDIKLRVIQLSYCAIHRPDIIHACWLKNLTQFHKKLAWQIEKLVTEGGHRSRLTQARAVLVMKDQQQGISPTTTYQSHAWKFLSGILTKNISDHNDGYKHLVQKCVGGGSRKSQR